MAPTSHLTTIVLYLIERGGYLEKTTPCRPKSLLSRRTVEGENQPRPHAGGNGPPSRRKCSRLCRAGRRKILLRPDHVPSLSSSRLPGSPIFFDGPFQHDRTFRAVHRLIHQCHQPLFLGDPPFLFETPSGLFALCLLRKTGDPCRPQRPLASAFTPAFAIAGLAPRQSGSRPGEQDKTTEQDKTAGQPGGIGLAAQKAEAPAHCADAPGIDALITETYPC